MITTTLHNYDYHYLLFLKYDLNKIKSNITLKGDNK